MQMEIRKQCRKLYSNKRNETSAYRGPLHNLGQQAINPRLCSCNHVETESSHIFYNTVTAIKLVSRHNGLEQQKLHSQKTKTMHYRNALFITKFT